tara:strand:+ start:1089 stop:1622 length:534 start_codon:yes stop_codon:yes gene_type:complete
MGRKSRRRAMRGQKAADSQAVKGNIAASKAAMPKGAMKAISSKRRGPGSKGRSRRRPGSARPDQKLMGIKGVMGKGIKGAAMAVMTKRPMRRPRPGAGRTYTAGDIALGKAPGYQRRPSSGSGPRKGGSFKRIVDAAGNAVRLRVANVRKRKIRKGEKGRNVNKTGENFQSDKFLRG